jgi:hypothetical protein
MCILCNAKEEELPDMANGFVLSRITGWGGPVPDVCINFLEKVLILRKCTYEMFFSR